MNLVEKLAILNKLIFSDSIVDVGVVSDSKIIDNTPENMSKACMSVYGIGYITSEALVIRNTADRTYSVSGRAADLKHKYNCKDFKVFIIDEDTVVGVADNYRVLDKLYCSMGVRDILDLDAVVLNPNDASATDHCNGISESIRFKNLYMLYAKPDGTFNQPYITWVTMDNIYIDGGCSFININAIDNESVHLVGLDYATAEVSVTNGGKLCLMDLTDSFITIPHIKQNDDVTIAHLSGTGITFGRLDKTVVLEDLKSCRIRVQYKYLDKLKFDKSALQNRQIYIDFLDQRNLEEESALDDIPVTKKNSKDIISIADKVQFAGYYRVVESNCKLHDIKKYKLSMKLKMLNFNTFAYNDYLGIVVNDRDGLGDNIDKNRDIDLICFGAQHESEKPRFINDVQYNKNYTVDANILVLNASNFIGKKVELKFRGALIANYSNLENNNFTYLLGIDSSCVYVDNMNESRLTVRPSDNANINIANFNEGSISLVNAEELHSVLLKNIENSVLKFENVNFNTIREGLVLFKGCGFTIIICHNCKGKIRFSECSRVLVFVDDNTYLIEESQKIVGKDKNNRHIEHEIDTETGRMYYV